MRELLGGRREKLVEGGEERILRKEWVERERRSRAAQEARWRWCGGGAGRGTGATMEQVGGGARRGKESWEGFWMSHNILNWSFNLRRTI